MSNINYSPISNIGNVYIADTWNNRVRKLTISTGIISLVAGTGSASYTGDSNAATSATLNIPTGVALDSSNSALYIADNTNHCMRKIILATGIITTIAGTGSAGTTGDGGAATSARLFYPSGVTIDSSGFI